MTGEISMIGVTSLAKWSNCLMWFVHPVSIKGVQNMRPSDAHMRRWTNHHCFRKWLVAWTAPSHYLNQCWYIVNWTQWNKFQWNVNRNSYIFIQENPFEKVVWKMAAILSRPQCVYDMETLPASPGILAYYQVGAWVFCSNCRVACHCLLRHRRLSLSRTLTLLIILDNDHDDVMIWNAWHVTGLYQVKPSATDGWILLTKGQV